MLKPNIRIHKVYKKYGDVWGELYRYGFKYRLKLLKTLDSLGKRPQYNNRYFQFTFYVGGFGFTRRRKTKYGQALIQKQQIKFFYGASSENSFRRKWKKAKNLRTVNSIIPSFINLLEQSLFIILIRSNLCLNVKDSFAIIKSQRVILINSSVEIVATPYKKINSSSILKVVLPISFRRIFRFLLKRRFHKFLPSVKHLDVDYKTFSIFVRKIDSKSLPYYPFKSNFSKLFNIYYS